MLSRIAESLYWIGRYVERAEDTSRILDVHLTLLLDDPWAPEDVVCASLMSAMGRQPDGSVGAAGVLDTLAWDRSTPASVLGALGAARENARRSREVVSAELWESINVTWHEASRPGRRAHPHAFLTWVRERSAAFNGTADATLSHDDAWHFLVLGRSIERADMTARLAAARALAGSAGPSWVTLLQSCGAYQAFLRNARGAVNDARSVEFLLLDPLFPRTLMSALVVAERCLDELAVGHGLTDRAREAHRALGMIRSELEFTPTAELLEDIYPVMERVQAACSTASDAVARQYFPRGVVTSWKVWCREMRERGMKARYRIQHTSTYRYDQLVTASFNEARLTPLATRWQNPLDVVLHVDDVSWQYRYVDYWGTQVRVFEAERPHRELVVRASSLVEVEPELRVGPDRDLTWAQLRSPDVRHEYGEFLAQLPSTEPAPDLAQLAESVVVDDPAATALAISAVVHEQMSYVPGSTGVQTSAAEAWSARSGVCQDYAHLVVGAMRHVGLPARYVSGYLHPNAVAALGEPVVGESHAWVEWWLGEWVAHDPTNSSMVSDRHVVIGMGRDYRDVPPIKGIVAGSPVTTDLEVEVEITRLA